MLVIFKVISMAPRGLLKLLNVQLKNIIYYKIFEL